MKPKNTETNVIKIKNNTKNKGQNQFIKTNKRQKKIKN